MIFKFAAGIALASALFSAPHATAAPELFGTSYYEFVLVVDPFSGNNNSWSTANAAAAASQFGGESGYLATITSQAENDFLLGLVLGNFPGFTGSWLGGSAPGGWLDGPEAGQAFSYTNWGGAEPNNSGFAYMQIGAAGPQGLSSGQWADDSGVQGVPDASFDPVVGYFVEYNVPEPSTSMLALLGITAVFCSRRRTLRTYERSA